MSKEVLTFTVGPFEMPPKSRRVFRFCPQVMFRVNKFEVLGDTKGLSITNIFVGNHMQLPTVAMGTDEDFFGKISAVSFTPGLDNEMKFDVCHPILDIAVGVVNDSDEPKMFEARFVGDEIENVDNDQGTMFLEGPV